MPGPQTITNPAGAYVTVSDYRTGVDVSGGEIAYGKSTYPFKAAGTIAKGDLCQLIVPTQTEPIRVQTMAAGGVGNTFIGVAAEAGVAGDIVEIVVEGPAMARVPAALATPGNPFTISGATAGLAAAITVDATAVVGTVFGRYMAAGTDTAGVLTPVYVKHQ